jgi:hypothetical protein
MGDVGAWEGEEEEREGKGSVGEISRVVATKRGSLRRETKERRGSGCTTN